MVDMTSTWIVGLDGSDGSASALRWASELARQRDERVTPIAAWHVPLPVWVMSGRRAIEVDRWGIEAEVAVQAAEAVGRIEHSSVVDEPQVIEGHPASILLGMAGRDTPLVVGRRGIGDLKHRLLGSVSQYLVTHSPGPVVVVPDEWETSPLKRIVVGFDGSEYAAAALGWALSIAPTDCEVEALVAVDVIPWLRPEAVAERHPDAVTHARARISHVADVADPHGRAFRNFVVEGPRSALAEAAERADLIVVGPRGIGGLSRAVLGSVTTWLLHDVGCPVAVVPSED